MRGQEFAKRDFKLNTAPWLVWLVSSDRLRTNVRQLVTCANGDISTRDCWSKETPVYIIVKPVPDEVRNDVTAAIEAAARQRNIPASFNLVYFASSPPTNTASKAA
jgi:hypothetical protein